MHPLHDLAIRLSLRQADEFLKNVKFNEDTSEKERAALASIKACRDILQIASREDLPVKISHYITVLPLLLIFSKFDKVDILLAAHDKTISFLMEREERWTKSTE